MVQVGCQFSFQGFRDGGKTYCVAPITDGQVPEETPMDEGGSKMPLYSGL